MTGEKHDFVMNSRGGWDREYRDSGPDQDTHYKAVEITDGVGTGLGRLLDLALIGIAGLDHALRQALRSVGRTPTPTPPTDEDPDAPHWHLGPVGVLRSRQGSGIGRELMKSFCGRMDAERAAAYLETDKDANVRFYEKSGFQGVGRKDVVGIPCWFMSRTPGTG